MQRQVEVCFQQRVWGEVEKNPWVRPYEKRVKSVLGNLVASQKYVSDMLSGCAFSVLCLLRSSRGSHVCKTATMFFKSRVNATKIIAFFRVDIVPYVRGPTDEYSKKLGCIPEAC